MSKNSILTDSDRHGIAKIREVLGDHIPEELNTDYNLRRWWLGFDGNMKLIHEKMSLYLRNRRVLKFDDPDFIENFYKNEEYMKIMQFFGMSRITENHVDHNNTLVFVEDGEFDRNVVYTCTTGQYLKVFFACCELVLQTILRVEKKTGKPCHGVCIFDMARIALGNHLNPSSPCNQVFQARALIWENFYPGMISNIVVANPPMVLTIVWSLAKFLLAEKQRELLKFCRNRNDIREIIGVDVIPVAYGGNLIDKPYSERRDCCNEKKTVNRSTDYFNKNSLFKKIQTDDPIIELTINIKAHSKCHINCRPLKHGDTCFLAWQFHISDQVQFSVHRGETLVYPSLKLITTEVAEEDIFIVDNADDFYVFEFANSNKLFSIKLRILLAAKDVKKIQDLVLDG